MSILKAKPRNSRQSFHEKIILRDILGIMLGSFIVAVSIEYVIAPAHMLTGGLSGMALVIHFLISQPLWLWNILLNIPAFIAGYRMVSSRFALYSLLGMFSLSAFLALLENWQINLCLDDILLSALLGGTLNGLGIGIALLFRGSTGGTDIIAAIFHRIWGINLGTTIFGTNILILLSGLVTSNLELTLYSALNMYISSKVVDTVTTGLGTKKTVLVISKQSQDIASTIINNTHRGCTFIRGQGAYTGQDKNIIMVTANKTQLPQLKEIIFSIDPHAFITITETVEVYGQGFRPWDSSDY